MDRKKLGIFFTLFLFIFMSFIFYNYFFSSETPQSEFHSQVEISGLSSEMNNSISSAIEKAKKFKEDNLFIFNILKNDKISNETPLVLKLVYEDGSQKRMMTTMPESFSGLSVSDLDSILKDWDIERYSPGDLLVLQHVNKLELPDEYCIGIKDDKVAIFYDKECMHLKQLTEIKVDKLAVHEKNMLKKGIIANSNEELLTILESLRSINED